MTERYQILEPLSSMIELALLNFSKERPKIIIRNHGICIDNPGDNKIVPQSINRWLSGDSKEDIFILNSMIVNYIQWFIIEDYNGKFEVYKNIALCAVSGMRKLQHTYKTGIVVLALQYFIVLIMKSISDIEVKRKLRSRSKSGDKLQDNNDNKQVIKTNLDTSEKGKDNKERDIILPEFKDDSPHENIEKEKESSTTNEKSNLDDDSILSDNDNDENEPTPSEIFRNKTELEKSKYFEDCTNVANNVGERDDSLFLTENNINDTKSLGLWILPMEQNQSIVDTTKIKQIWTKEDMDEIYKMISSCFDMTNQYHFKPKSGDFVDAKIDTLIKVLQTKDNKFNDIIKNSYGTM